jgi:hypothetical protein
MIQTLRRLLVFLFLKKWRLRGVAGPRNQFFIQSPATGARFFYSRAMSSASGRPAFFLASKIYELIGDPSVGGRRTPALHFRTI